MVAVHGAVHCAVPCQPRREALRRITEGAAMIRSGARLVRVTYSNATATRARSRDGSRSHIVAQDELARGGQEIAGAVRPSPRVAELGKLPVTLFTAGGSPRPPTRR